MMGQSGTGCWSWSFHTDTYHVDDGSKVGAVAER